MTGRQYKLHTSKLHRTTVNTGLSITPPEESPQADQARPRAEVAAPPDNTCVEMFVCIRVQCAAPPCESPQGPKAQPPAARVAPPDTIGNCNSLRKVAGQTRLMAHIQVQPPLRLHYVTPTSAGISIATGTSMTPLAVASFMSQSWCT